MKCIQVPVGSHSYTKHQLPELDDFGSSAIGILVFVETFTFGYNGVKNKETFVTDSILPVRDTLTEIARLLPTDASLEDVQYHLYVRQQVEAGLADEEAGRLIDTDEMRKRLAAHKRAKEDRGQ